MHFVEISPLQPKNFKLGYPPQKKGFQILNFSKIVQIWAKLWVSGTIGEQHKS
jgi:hypothetical protein